MYCSTFPRGWAPLPLKGSVWYAYRCGSMLVTLMFDFHTAIFFSFIVSLLSGLWLLDAVYPVYAFVGSLTAAFSVIRCKKRSALLKGGLFVGGASIVTSILLLLSQGDSSQKKLFPLNLCCLNSSHRPAIVSCSFRSSNTLFMSLPT